MTDLHHRRSIRLSNYDYTQAGFYFFTLVTWQRVNLFGSILNGTISLSQAGLVAQGEWQHLAGRFPFVELDEFVIMPNHVHGILILREIGDGETLPDRQAVPNDTGARQLKSPISGKRDSASPLPVAPGTRSLGSVVGAYKSTCTRLVNGLYHHPGSPIWQRNYFEHIIRDDDDLKRIREYIRNNPLRWDEDQENPLRKSQLSSAAIRPKSE